MKGLAVDLVIWNDDHGGYRQVLHDQIMGLIGSGIEASVIDRPGGVFVRLAEQIAPEDRILLQAVARTILSDNRGGLGEQIKRRDLLEPSIPRFAPTRTYRAEDASSTPLLADDLILATRAESPAEQDDDSAESENQSDQPIERDRLLAQRERGNDDRE